MYVRVVERDLFLANSLSRWSINSANKADDELWTNEPTSTELLSMAAREMSISLTECNDRSLPDGHPRVCKLWEKCRLNSRVERL